jgi:ABC-2 type transport system ATP-binding protein
MICGGMERVIGPTEGGVSAAVDHSGQPEGLAGKVDEKLRLDGIVKSWSSQPQPVLDGVALGLRAGTVTSISGANGAGKTTLLRIAAGLIRPEQGEVTLSGLSPERDRKEFQRQVGFLTAGNSGLYGRLKAEHHLDFWARLALLPRTERSAAIDRVVGVFGLGPLLGRRVDRLSMGQRQRLRLALTFLHHPSLILLDEPATSLDAEGIGVLQGALDHHRSSGGAALICLPTGWEEMLKIDRAYLLSGGALRPAG